MKNFFKNAQSYYEKRLKRYKLNFLDNIYSLDKYIKENENEMKIKEILMRENDF